MTSTRMNLEAAKDFVRQSVNANIRAGRIVFLDDWERAIVAKVSGSHPPQQELREFVTTYPQQRVEALDEVLRWVMSPWSERSKSTPEIRRLCHELWGDDWTLIRDGRIDPHATEELFPPSLEEVLPELLPSHEAGKKPTRFGKRETNLIFFSAMVGLIAGISFANHPETSKPIKSPVDFSIPR